MSDAFEAHPVADLIQTLLERDGEHGPIVLRGAGFETLRETIDHYAASETPEIMAVAETAYSVADWLEGQRAFEAAEGICALLDRPNVLGAMRAVIERVQAASIESDGPTFAEFASIATVRAPSLDAEAPEDSVKAGHMFPRRL
jgi:hypothetical protein